MIKIITKISIALFLMTAGCNMPPQPESQKTAEAKMTSYEDFGPVKIEILPLTEFSASEKGQKIIAFLSLKDSFGSSQKWPVIFRFELYEQVPRSVEPMGKRIKIWPDIDLKTPAKNNQFWQDFLRC